MRHYWKQVAIALAVLAVIAFVHSKISQMKQDAYNHGVTDERNRVIKLIAAENTANRTIESQLQGSLDAFGHKLDQKQQTRVQQELVLRDKVSKAVNADPSQACKTNPAVTEARNAIRSSLQ